MTPCMWTVDSTWHNMFNVWSVWLSPNHSHGQTYDVSLHAIICFKPCCMSSLCIGTPPAGSDCNCHWPIPTVAHFQLYCILSSCDTTYIVFLSGLGCQLLKHIISCLSMETLVFLIFYLGHTSQLNKLKRHETLFWQTVQKEVNVITQILRREKLHLISHRTQFSLHFSLLPLSCLSCLFCLSCLSLASLASLPLAKFTLFYLNLSHIALTAGNPISQLRDQTNF